MKYDKMIINALTGEDILSKIFEVHSLTIEGHENDKFDENIVICEIPLESGDEKSESGWYWPK